MVAQITAMSDLGNETRQPQRSSCSDLHCVAQDPGVDGRATAAAKIAVEICAQTLGTLTGCSGGANGIPANIVAGGDDVTDNTVLITTEDGDITATSSVNSGLDGATYTLDATMEGNRVVWDASCDPATIC